MPKNAGDRNEPFVGDLSRRLPPEHPEAAERHPKARAGDLKIGGLNIQPFDDELMAGSECWQNQTDPMSPA
jgi:hypothetical protein